VQQRNPGVSREQLERAFHDFLGIRTGAVAQSRHCRRRYTWHCGRHFAVCRTGDHCDGVEPDLSDPNHAPLADESLARLKAAALVTGSNSRWSTLPMPRPVVVSRQRPAGQLCKLYLSNGLVLLPTFHDP